MSELKDLIEERGITLTLTDVVNVVETNLSQLDRNDEGERLLGVAVEGELQSLRHVIRKNNFDILRKKVISKIG